MQDCSSQIFSAKASTLEEQFSADYFEKLRNKNREQNQDLKQLEQTKEQQSTFKSIADGVSNIGGVSDIPASVADETIKNTTLEGFKKIK